MAAFKDLSFAEQSWHCAMLSKICYETPDTANPQFEELGYTADRITYLDVDSSQGYILESDTENVVVCRGTEVDEKEDAISDLKVWYSRDAEMGLVHTGFLISVNRLWPQVYSHLMANPAKPAYFTGHSLGAAMATIMAVRMLHTYEMVKPRALFTYGSPKPFSIIGAHTTAAGIPHYRWVNNMDIVPRSPGFLMGYGHCGKQHYINSWGNVVNYGFWRRELDKILAIKRAAQFDDLGYVDSHGMVHYIAALERYKNGIVLPEGRAGYQLRMAQEKAKKDQK
jgi:triacylglycerol lipase